MDNEINNVEISSENCSSELFGSSTTEPTPEVEITPQVETFSQEDEPTILNEVNSNSISDEITPVPDTIPALPVEETVDAEPVIETVEEKPDEVQPEPAPVATEIIIEEKTEEVQPVPAEVPVEPVPEPDVVEQPIQEIPAVVAVETVDVTAPVVATEVEAASPAVEPTEIEGATLVVPTEPVVAVTAGPKELTQEEKDAQKSMKQEKLDAIFKDLAERKANKENIEVEVKARIRGGLRVTYHDVPLFLPASHFSLKRTPTEQELTEAVGHKILVEIHELQEYDEGRKAVIVSRKKILTDDFWNRISVGDIVEGKVSSIASFGVFVDLGGVEGLIHISRLSQVHVDDPNRFVKKGDTIRAVVVELEKGKNRIALSRKELEESPWAHVEEEFLVGETYTGIVRRLTDFGAYIELKPGVDGLLRTPEISWTKRIKRPADVLTAGQDIPVQVLAVSADKQTISISYKKTQPNPWLALVDKYPVGAEFEGVIFQVMPQGVIVSIDDTIDGFMPRSKMRPLLQGNKIPYHPGDKIAVIIADLIPDEESLILSPKVDETAYSSAPPERQPRQQSENTNRPKLQKPSGGAVADNATGISLLDMLSESQKKNLFDSAVE